MKESFSHVESHEVPSSLERLVSAVKGAVMMAAVSLWLQSGQQVAAQNFDQLDAYGIPSETLDDSRQTWEQAASLLRMNPKALEKLLKARNAPLIQSTKEELRYFKIAQKDFDKHDVPYMDYEELIRWAQAEIDRLKNEGAMAEELRLKAERMQEFVDQVESARAGIVDYVSGERFLAKLAAAGHPDPKAAQQQAIQLAKQMRILIPYERLNSGSDVWLGAPVGLVVDGGSFVVQFQQADTPFKKDRLRQIIEEEYGHLWFSLGAADPQPQGIENITDKQRQVIAEVFDWSESEDSFDRSSVGGQISAAQNYLNTLPELAAKTMVFCRDLARQGIRDTSELTEAFVAEQLPGPGDDEPVVVEGEEDIWHAISDAMKKEQLTTPSEQMWGLLVEGYPDMHELRQAVAKLQEVF